MRQTRLACLALLFLLTDLPLRAAQDGGGLPISETIVTNLSQFWALSPDEKNVMHRAQLDILIYYCDPDWNVFWGRSGELDTFLPLKGLSTPIKPGDKIHLEGLALPVNHEFIPDKTSVTILSESNSLPFVSADDRLFDSVSLNNHLVEIGAVVDSQTKTATNVLMLGLLAQNFHLAAYVYMRSNEPVPQLTGKLVRIKGVYANTLDVFGKVATITLWVPGLDGVTTTGSLANDPRFSKFSAPLITSADFASADPRALIRVQGEVRNQQPGRAVTMWDNTGQIRVLTKQEQVLQVGDWIEAVGYPTSQGINRVLRDGLFRMVSNSAERRAAFQTRQTLCLAEQIRALDQEKLDRHLTVRLEGAVTWVNADENFCYVLDSSGGMRVMQSQLPDGRTLVPGMMVRVDGVVTAGKFAPVVTNAVVHQTGNLSLPDAPLTSLEETMTGTEDGRLVKMRGYVGKVIQDSHKTCLNIVAAGGEFKAWTPRAEALNGLEGSVVLIEGVCVAVPNDRGQLTHVEIWSPQLEDILVEQSAPPDLFALPLHPLASLRRFNLFSTLNERVRTCGTVTLQSPGRYLYLQDGDSSVLALSSQTGLLHPGDRVEVVGFCGNENGNFLLREAVYRRVASGPEPTPLQLSPTEPISIDSDGLLVRAKGTLLNVVEKMDGIHLIVQAAAGIFEAKWDQASGFAEQKPALGSRVALMGVYRLQRDENNQPRSFVIELRNARDVQVLQQPPWWTLSRLLWALTAALAVFVIALGWALQTRRKNNLLVQAQKELKIAHDELEGRVDERTRELREEVEAKERAHAELSGAQQALKRSEERFAKAFRASPVPLVLQDAADQRYVDINDSFLEMTGFRGEAVLGRTPLELNLFPQLELLRDIRDAARTQRTLRNLQGSLRITNGKTLTVLISTEWLELDGRPHFLMSLQDITERVNMEDQLRQAQKMEVVGQIAAGVAHDFNNILTIIQGHAEFQLNMSKLDESVAESLHEISSAAERAASLTRQLLAFSRKQMLQRRPLDVAESLKNLSKMLERIIGEHISMRIRCAPNLPPIFADTVNFEQIIINLAVNARDAMPRGGPLTISAERVVIDEKYKERESDAVVGTFVRLSVADEGSGMDETVRRKIFEPFFTTTGVGKGTGMGLATVYGIVKQHQGWIEVESKPGAGSTFKVFLPVTEQAAQRPIVSKSNLNKIIAAQSRTIFLVEDEVPLREMASTILRRMGYQVLTAGNGPEALALWPEHRGKVDLLLTDMVMPGGMTGRELAECLLREAPEMPVIYSTGYSMDLINSDNNFGTQAECLFKPYDASALANAVNKVFANGN